MNLETWRKEMGIWLDGFPWQWFCTLTFRPGLSPKQARWRLHAWLDELRASLGTAGFGYFAVREMGKTGHDLHFHVLLMGLKRWHGPERVDFMRRWNKGAGDARIDIYTPKAGGIGYILKGATPDDPDGIEFDLSSSARLQAGDGTEMTYDDHDKFVAYLDRVTADDFDWFVTLTVPFALRETDIDAAFDEWIAEIEDVDGVTKWARVAEKKDEFSFELQVLIGGRSDTRRYKWIRAWEERTGGEARSRRLGTTEQLRGLLRYLIVRRECGFRAKEIWGPGVSFRGRNE